MGCTAPTECTLLVPKNTHHVIGSATKSDVARPRRNPGNAVLLQLSDNGIMQRYKASVWCLKITGQRQMEGNLQNNNNKNKKRNKNNNNNLKNKIKRKKMKNKALKTT